MGEVHQGAGGVVAVDLDVAAVEFVQQCALAGEGGRFVDGGAVVGPDVHADQVAVHPGGGAGAAADQVLSLRGPVEGDDDAFLGLPGRPDAVPGAVVGEFLLDPVGQPEQGEFAQGAEVAGPEVVVQGDVDPVGRVDRALGHPGAQGLRAEVDEFDPVGGADHLVGDPLALGDAGDLLDDVVEALQVLDVDGGGHVDAGVEEFPDVLPAFGVAAAGGVGVGEFVDERELRAAGEQGVDVEFGEGGTAVADGAAGQHGQVPELVLGAPAAVGLDQSDDDVEGFVVAQPPALGEHGARLADPRRSPQEHPQSSAHRRAATSSVSMLRRDAGVREGTGAPAGAGGHEGTAARSGWCYRH